tara:strand:+ start:1005 stop:1664 length:660 start_codon:yes stop_codon:yes gene_type:complete
MHQTVTNLLNIKEQISLSLSKLNIYKIPKIIAVSKTFPLENILPLIEYGHDHFGENKVQEAIEKWTDIKIKNKNLKLHLIGKLQTNKVKFAIKLFDYIHSLDSLKLAKKISDEQSKLNKIPKLFIQINIGKEEQKSGINMNDLQNFKKECLGLGLNILGTMCLPPFNEDPTKYFEQMREINKENGFNELSMGMSNDYIEALNYNSTFLRIGSNIFGKRS